MRGEIFKEAAAEKKIFTVLRAAWRIIIKIMQRHE